MRRFSLAASILGLLLFGFASTGSAITLIDDPLNFAFSGVTGSIDFLPSSTDTQLDMQVTLTSGDLDALALVVCETADCGLPGGPLNVRDPDTAGTVPGPGVNVPLAFVLSTDGIGEANFFFSNFPGGMGTTDTFFVTYNDTLQSGDYLLFGLADFRGFLGKKSKFGSAITQVPEPTTLLLLALGMGGLGGLAIQGRRPKQA